MNTKLRSLTKLLLLSALLLAWAGTAFAKQYIVDSVTVTVSSLNAQGLGPTDTILVRGNTGVLFVDANATIGSLTIGDSTTSGNATFNSVSPQTLAVTGDVQFGLQPANFLDMTLSTANTLQSGEAFLRPGWAAFVPVRPPLTTIAPRPSR